MGRDYANGVTGREREMAIENVRIPVSDDERNPILKEMSEKGFTLVAVTDDGWSDGRIRLHYWSMYFTRTVPKSNSIRAADAITMAMVTAISTAHPECSGARHEIAI